MNDNQIEKVLPSSPVWLWIIRAGNGDWLPGFVVSVKTLKNYPVVSTRFEGRSFGKTGANGAPFVGISTTRMHCLECRDPGLKGADRPAAAPGASITPAIPSESPACADSSASSPGPTRAKKPRTRRKAVSSDSVPQLEVTAVEA
jgi:hypothetical protein